MIAGTRPHSSSGSANVARSVAMTQSHAQASPMPPPIARPSTTASSGFGGVMHRRQQVGERVGRRAGRQAGRPTARPRQNVFGAGADERDDRRSRRERVVQLAGQRLESTPHRDRPAAARSPCGSAPRVLPVVVARAAEDELALTFVVRLVQRGNQVGRRRVVARDSGRQ